MSPRFEPAIGRYLHLDLLGRPHRLYVEEAGQGIPLLCLHTAGSDGRQYRGLLNDARITEELSRDRVRHAVARQILAAGRLGERGIPAHLARLCAHDPRGLRRARARQAGRDGLLDRRAHRAASRARAPGEIPRDRRARILAQGRPLLRHELAASPRRAWRRGLGRHRVRAGRADRARRGPLGDAVALHAERPRRVQGRPLFLHDRRRHLATSSTTSTRAAARSICSPANTTIPAPPRARSRSRAAPARRRPS